MSSSRLKFWLAIGLAVVMTLAVISMVDLGIFDWTTSSQYDFSSSPLMRRRLKIGGNTLLVETVSAPIDMKRGLSNRDRLSEDSGMLFDFGEPTKPKMWMKDMRFSLDLIWLDQTGAIVEVTANVSPNTWPQTFEPSQPVSYVLEVNAGWVARHGVVVGQKFTD